MARHVWVSTTGDVAAAASWDSGVAPSAWAATDTAEFNDSSTTAPSSNLNQSAITIARLTVTTACDLNIGSSGNPLRFTFATPAGDFKGLVYRGTGAMHFGGTGTVTFLVNSSNLADALVLYNDVGHTYVRSGHVRITSGATCTGGRLFVDGMNASVIYDPSSSVSHAEHRLNNGYIYEGRPQSLTASGILPRIIVNGGLWEQDAVLDNTSVTYLDINGGTFRVLKRSGITVFQANLLYGILDMYQGSFKSTATIVIGKDMIMLGGPVMQAYPGTGFYIDAREEYP